MSAGAASGLGVTADTPLEKMYREARYARIYDGPDEVHRMALANRIMRNVQSAPWYDSPQYRYVRGWRMKGRGGWNGRMCWL